MALYLCLKIKLHKNTNSDNIFTKLEIPDAPLPHCNLVNDDARFTC